MHDQNLESFTDHDMVYMHDEQGRVISASEDSVENLEDWR